MQLNLILNLLLYKMKCLKKLFTRWTGTRVWSGSRHTSSSIITSTLDTIIHPIFTSATIVTNGTITYGFIILSNTCTSIQTIQARTQVCNKKKTFQDKKFSFDNSYASKWIKKLLIVWIYWKLIQYILLVSLITLIFKEIILLKRYFRKVQHKMQSLYP